MILQKTPFDSNTASEITQLLDRADAIEHNDIVRFQVFRVDFHTPTPLCDFNPLSTTGILDGSLVTTRRVLQT